MAGYWAQTVVQSEAESVLIAGDIPGAFVPSEEPTPSGARYNLTGLFPSDDPRGNRRLSAGCQPKNQEGSLKLVGTIAGPPESMALLQSGRSITYARLGDEIDGWRIDTVSPGGITIARDDRQVNLKLDCAPPTE